MASRTASGNPGQRMAIGGGWAEAEFIAYAQRNKISIERYGFDHAKIRNFRALPSFVRHTPDYAATKSGEGFLVECKGAGRGKVVNLKLEDMDAWKEWLTHAPVYLFVYDSDKKQVTLQGVQEVIDECFWGDVPTDVWHDGVEHYKVPKSFFDWEVLDG